MATKRQVPRRLDELVDHQVSRWQLQERRPAPGPPPPCVALSRQPGSAAREIGHRVAELLGFGFFDIEIVDRIARESGIQRELVAGLDEHVRNTIDRWVMDAFRTQPFTETDYLRGVVRTVATLGERGMAVILGRGSPYILAADRALRALVVAPRPARVEHLAREQDLAPEEAERRLQRLDADRREFLYRDFDVTADDPTHFDLCVNSAALGTEGAAALVVGALRQRFPEVRGP